MKKNLLFVLALVAVMSAGAYAGQATANLAVSATVSPNCIISATQALAFGAYDPIAANRTSHLDATGEITTRCTNGANAKITLGQGANPDAGSTDAVPIRRMKSGSNYLIYTMFGDETRTIGWGNTADTGLVDVGSGLSSTLDVCGRIPADQNVPAGSYSDTVVATITF